METYRTTFALPFDAPIVRRVSRRCTSTLRMATANKGAEARVPRLQRLRDVAEVSKDLPPFAHSVRSAGHQELRTAAATTLQVNIGLTCNMACTHCHVESSPLRKETMLRTVADRLVALTRASGNAIRAVDITGGAPEMHREFRRLVQQFRSIGLSVMDRCNLSVLFEPGQEDLATFLADNQVKVIASMPCYSADNVNKQRGDGAFDRSIQALQLLNSVGYGRPGSGLELDLVYNPIGAFLPPPQSALEADYKRELKREFDIDFSSLICITNLPVKRYADDLRRSGKLLEYMELLVQSFNPATVPNVMCRSMVHVSHDGSINDCDFNYALGMKVAASSVGKGGSSQLTVFDIEDWSELTNRRINTGYHCYGCTAGHGSSCGGSLE
eukprot:Plantae.Rhodophyta-Rhodochaete_pulchella.ctg17548.p1 GENE.Plantae.Rhodophyta-Rhodochaete_pulchella.ctg17548~~Plantae.Rhodophyta-Rhodochaete_pulchella.ctg17548.p1  ORF type:complete len:385 (+),score=45.43 Plantae.Rhodophyta-Rhodochaete_pulchella.ctg17548:182-1336(+)